MKVAILGGGPSGAFAAAQLASNGIKTVVFDEKLAWEKPCGGGLTYKAYSAISISRGGRRDSEEDRPQNRAFRAQEQTGFSFARSSPVDLLALRPERHAARSRPTKPERNWRRRAFLKNSSAPARGGLCAPGAARSGCRLLHRRHRRAQPLAGRWYRAYFQRCDERPRLLHSGRKGLHRHSVSSRARRLYMGVSALRSSVGGNLRQG